MRFHLSLRECLAFVAIYDFVLLKVHYYGLPRLLTKSRNNKVADALVRVIASKAKQSII